MHSLSVPWISKPLRPATVSIDHGELARLGLGGKLQAFIIMTQDGAIELVSGQRPVNIDTNGGSWGAGKYGICQDFVPGNQHVIAFDSSILDGWPTSDTANSIDWGGNLEAVDSNAGSITISWPHAAGHMYCEYQGGGNSYYMNELAGNAGSSFWTSQGYAHHATVSLNDGSNRLRAYVNGVEASATSGQTVDIRDPNGDVEIGLYTGHASDWEFDGKFSFLRIWDTDLSVTQVKALSQNPWRILKPQTLILSAEADAGSNTTIEVPLGPVW